MAVRSKMKFEFCVLLLMMSLLACGGPQERKAQYRAKAQDYIQAGNFPKARVALRNVLKIDPKDADAYFLVAQVEEKEKNWRNAVANYQQVVELVPDHKEALIVLAKYYLEAKLADEVGRAADKVLATHPQDPQAQALKIALLAQQGQVNQAVVRAEQLSKQHPTEPDVAILLATLYGQIHRLSDARVTLQRAIQTHPHHLDLLQNLKTILVEAHDAKATEQVLRQIIQEEPTIYDHRLKLARFFDQLHAHDQAETVLREALTVFPENDQAWLALADFLKIRRGKEAARVALRQAAKRLAYSTQIQFALATLYESHKDFAEAKRVYEALEKDYDKKPAGLDAQVKIAQLDFNAGRQEEAERRLSGVLRQNPHSAQGLILQGKMALIQRNGKDAVQAFRTVLRDQPELAHVHYLLGQAYLTTSDSSLAREGFERAVALQPDLVDANLALAAMESRNGQSQIARTRLKSILTSHPDHRQAMEVLFGLDLAAGDWNHAASILGRLRQLEGETPAILMAEGKLYESRKEFAQATAAYERAATMAVDTQEPLVAVVQLDLQNKQPERAKRRLEGILAAHPDHPYANGLMGEVLTLVGRQDSAMAHFRDAIRINPRWLTPWLDAATLFIAQGHAVDAVRILREGLNTNPASEELHMLLASVLASQNAVDEAIAAYDAVLRMNPRNIFSANNLAALLADHKQDASNLERAFRLSREFEKDAPHPLFLDTLAWVRLKMGHLEEALRIMRQAIVKAPDLPTLNYHLGVALYQSGRNSEAKVYLAKALKSTEQFQGRSEAQQLLARSNG